MLIDKEIKRLIIETEESATKKEQEIKLIILIKKLKERLELDENKKRYAEYKINAEGIGLYPIDAYGYAIAYDPIEQEEELWNAWLKYGVVVTKNIISGDDQNGLLKKIKSTLQLISENKCNIDDPDTYSNMPKDINGVPLISRGFLELYHDKSLANIRQSLRLYIQHVIIWGSVDLWTSFDRVGVKLPNHEESKALPLHVDQNPNIHPEFKTTQGVIALVDCPKEVGTFCVVPGSKKYFLEYKSLTKNNGEYVELDGESTFKNYLSEHTQTLPLRSGNMVTWDSRTTHANTENVSSLIRYVMYTSAGPAKEDDDEIINIRQDAFSSGIGSNSREALMHASKKPRYSDYNKIAQLRQKEELTLLGELLYGNKKYKNEIK